MVAFIVLTSYGLRPFRVIALTKAEIGLTADGGLLFDHGPDLDISAQTGTQFLGLR